MPPPLIYLGGLLLGLALDRAFPRPLLPKAVSRAFGEEHLRYKAGRPPLGLGGGFGRDVLQPLEYASLADREL